MSTEHFTPLDIETGDADDLYLSEPGPDYVRLTGAGGSIVTSRTGPHGVVHPRTPYVTVNGHLFDFPALDRHAGIPVEHTIPFSRDLRVAAFQHDPPTTYQTSPGPGFKSYKMDALADRYLGGAAKSDTLKQLAKEYGGFDRIPVGDLRYSEYLRDDLTLTAQLNEAIPWDPYEEREAWVATITARTTLNGFRVDTAGLSARVDELSLRSLQGRTMLAEQYGFPLTNKAGKEAKAPQRTNAGKEAFESALTSMGFPTERWPRGADGSLSLSKEVMGHAAQYARDNALSGPLTVIEAVQEMNGIRTSAANLQRMTGSDGRVRYTFEPFQSTGRWSCGLTVLKKGVADSERMFLVADDDCDLVSIDLDQIDIRGAAAHAQDPNLLALLNDPSRDIHTEISAMAKVPRKQGKTFDLGWLYGRSARAMAEMPGADPEAAHAVVRYMAEAFPLVRPWQTSVRERGEAGILLDNGWGRRLRVDAQRAYTQAPAMIGQSTTRDVIAHGLISIARRAPEILPMLRVIVHDEVVACVPRREREEVARTIQECLSFTWAPAGASIPVNITAGQGKPFVFAERWGDLYM